MKHAQISIGVLILGAICIALEYGWLTGLGVGLLCYGVGGMVEGTLIRLISLAYEIQHELNSKKLLPSRKGSISDAFAPR